MSKRSLVELLSLLLIALTSYAQTTNHFRFTIPTPAGPVSVLDFRDHIAGRIGDTVFLEENNRFSIGFLKSDNSFGIVLSAKPVSVARQEAEEKFLRDLGVSEKDACKLKVTVRVPDQIDANANGDGAGLSFCSSTTSH